MAKSKKPPTEPTKPRAFMVRLQQDAASRVEATAKGLGLDEANFLRMIIVENLPAYERRVEQLKTSPSDKI